MMNNKSRIVYLKGVGTLLFLIFPISYIFTSKPNDAIYFFPVMAIVFHTIAYIQMPKDVKTTLRSEFIAFIYILLIAIGLATLIGAAIFTYGIAPNWNFGKNIGNITLGELISSILVLVLLAGLLKASTWIEKINLDKIFDELWSVKIEYDASWEPIFKDLGFSNYGNNSICRIEIKNLTLSKLVNSIGTSELTLESDHGKVIIYETRSKTSVYETTITYDENTNQLFCQTTLGQTQFNMLYLTLLKNNEMKIDFLSPMMAKKQIGDIPKNEPLRVKNFTLIYSRVDQLRRSTF